MSKKITNNIILIGFMGTGKSTLGAGLSACFCCDFIDTDTQVENMAKMDIPTIFNQFGEPYFRELEHQAVLEASSQKNMIISTGGGVVKNPLNMNALKRSGLIIFLDSSPSRIFENTKDLDKPLLMGFSGNDRLIRIEQLLNERKSVYEQYADVIVFIETNAVSENINLIISKITSFTPKL